MSGTVDGEVELLNAINVPLESDAVTFTKGMDGFPAFSFNSRSNVFRSAPDIIHRVGPDFSIFAAIHPVTSTGFLFAVVDPSHTYVQFGLRLSSGESDYRRRDSPRGVASRNRRNITVISLYYADSPPTSTAGVRDDVTQVSSNSAAATWVVDSLVGRWSSIAVQTRGPDVALIIDCDQVSPDSRVIRLPQGLTFDWTSTLYVAQGGPRFAYKFEVSLHNVLVECYCNAATGCDAKRIHRNLIYNLTCRLIN